MDALIWCFFFKQLLKYDVSDHTFANSMTENADRYGQFGSGSVPKVVLRPSPFTNNPGSASVAILRLCYSRPGLEHCHTISNPKENTEKL